MARGDEEFRSVSQESRSRLTWFMVGLLGLALLGIAWFLVTDAAVYLNYSPGKYTDYYWPRRIGLIFHVGASTAALTVGLVQLWLGLSARNWAFHRVLGRIYLIAVSVGVCASAYMAATIPPGMSWYVSGLVGLGLAWAVTTYFGYRFIRQGKLELHRAWMIRSYVVTFSFVTLRVIAAIIAWLGIMTYDDATTPAAWLCWVLPLLLLEIAFLRRRRSFTIGPSR
jgi:uncharacterized membrane protein YozB (DUF420 family)